MSSLSERLRELRDPNSFYFRSAEAFLKKMADSVDRMSVEPVSGAGAKEDRTLPYAIRGEELAKLSQEFGWRMKIVPREFSRVPYAAAKSYCANILNENIKSWAGEEVVHLEGDLGAIAVRRQTWKHVCRAGADSRSLLRYVRQDASLARMTHGGNLDVALMARSILDQSMVNGGMNVCSNAKACRHICDTVLFDLAEADIPARQAAVVALQHSATRSKVWFYFETAMLYQDEGPLTSFPGRFFVDRAGDRLYVIPEGMVTSDTIEYSWSNILSYVSQSTVQVDGGVFLVEIHDSVPGVYFVSVSDARGECEFEVESDHRLFHPAGEKAVEVTQRMVLPRSVSATGKFEEVTVRVPQDMWEKTVARLMAVKETKLNLQEARIAVADYSQQRVDVGAVVRAPRALPYDVPEVFARAAWKKAVEQRLRMNLESRLAREGVELQWNGLLSRLVASGMRMLYETASTVGEVLLDLGACLSRFEAEMKDYEVAVRIADTAERVGGLYKGLDPRFAVAYPGGEVYDATSLTDASEVRQRVRSLAMEVYEGSRYFSDSDDGGEIFDGEVAVGGPVQLEYSRLEEARNSGRDLGGDREKLVDKMEHVYDAGMVRSVARVVEEYGTVAEPVCSVEVCTGDPVSVLQSEYVEAMPALSGYRPEVTPYLFGEADKAFDIDVARLVSNSRLDEAPKAVRVRKSRLLTACSGRRPMTQSEVMLAFTKRVANAPVLAADVVYAERLASDFERFQSVFLRDGWKDRMVDAVAGGLWSLDVVELRKHAAKLPTSAVGNMLSEDFRWGNIDMSSWVAMVKSTVKPKVSEAASTVYSAPQTIIYQQSKMTNSMFSPALSKFLDFLDQEVHPWIRMNARRDRSDDERWANSMEQRTAAGPYQDIEVDISQCDKSQCLYNMMLFFYVLEQFGAPEELVSVWKVMIGQKKAVATDVGMVIWYMYQVVSGFFGTIAANTLITAVANVVCLDLKKEDIVRAEFRGDDGHIRVRRRVEAAEATERFAYKFNMEAKVFVDVPVYFCSMYEVKVRGYLFRIRDPEKLRESLGRFVASTADLEEMYESFQDAGRHYEKKEVLDALAEAVFVRTGVRLRGSLRALSSLVQNKEFFIESYEEETCEIGF